ncbi:MAG: ABC transporter permease, partial [Gammaproteobacteria bacterium]|nr:ABC transporter permease [Gammaproteobacteria bacterium]
MMRLSVLVLLVWALMALLAQQLPLAPDRIALEHILDPPAAGALLGYDDLGRDIAARLITGAQTSFMVAVWVVGLSLLAGTLFGTLTAYRGGWWDRIAVLVVDIF